MNIENFHSVIYKFIFVKQRNILVGFGANHCAITKLVVSEESKHSTLPWKENEANMPDIHFFVAQNYSMQYSP